MFPFFVLLVARGFTTLRDPRVLGGVLVVVVVLGFAGGVRNSSPSARRRPRSRRSCATRRSPATSWCTAPTRSAPRCTGSCRRASTRSCTRASPGPRSIDWVDYKKRLAAADRPRSPVRALARAGSHTLWYVSAPGYITHVGTCEALSADFAKARAGVQRTLSEGQDLREAGAPDVPGAHQGLNALSRPHRSRSVLVPYVISRVLVVGALATIRHIVHDRARQPVPVQLHAGLLAWDASWYRDIARGGYDGVATEGLRFFPLFPMLGRAVSWLPGASAGFGVVLVANVSALVLGFALHALVMQRTRRRDLARRAVWLVYLAPPAFVLVMGYAEATFMTLRRAHAARPARAGVGGSPRSSAARRA